MTAQEKLHRLEGIFQDVLDRPDLKLTEGFSTADCPEWDSVASVQIILAVEEAFQLRAPAELLGHLQNVRQLLDLLP